jgi:hypothetical protein
MVGPQGPCGPEGSRGYELEGTTINTSYPMFYNPETQEITYNKNVFMSPVDGYNASDLLAENSVQYLPNTFPSGGWCGGVLSPNGKIYWIPTGGGTVVIVDPITNMIDISSITDLSNITVNPANSQPWEGGVLGPNGKIYVIPDRSPNVAVIDTETNKINYISVMAGITAGSNAARWNTGILAPNGKIYSSFRWNNVANYGSVLKIDPDTNTVSFIPITSGLSTNLSKFYGGALGVNGKIYLMPYVEGRVLEIDPTTDTVQFLPELAPGGILNKYISGVLAPNGFIYGIPYESTYLLKIDTRGPTGIVSYGPVNTPGLVGSAKWRSGVLGTDGKIYCSPESSTSILVINPVDDSFEFINVGSSENARCGAVLAPNNKIYLVGKGRNNSNLAIIKPGPPTEPPWMLAASFNKY